MVQKEQQQYGTDKKETEKVLIVKDTFLIHAILKG